MDGNIHFNAATKFALSIVYICTLFSPDLNTDQKSIEVFIADGDSAFVKFKNELALEYYQKALNLDPKEYHAIWRCGRVYVEIGEHLPKDQQLFYYRKAEIMADSAISVNPDGYEGHTYRAIAFGKIALFKGVWKSIGLAKEMRKELEIALELNPDDDIALYVYGRTHQKIAEKGKLFRYPLGLGWASKKKAKEYYEAALKFRPNLVLYNIDYARLLVQLKKFEDAREVLTNIPSMPITDQDDEWNKGNASKLLQEISAK